MKHYYNHCPACGEDVKGLDGCGNCGTEFVDATEDLRRERDEARLQRDVARGTADGSRRDAEGWMTHAKALRARVARLEAEYDSLSEAIGAFCVDFDAQRDTMNPDDNQELDVLINNMEEAWKDSRAALAGDES